MKDNLVVFFQKVEPNYLSFFAGILTSAAINIYTDVFLSAKLPDAFFVIMLSFGCLLTSSLLFAGLSLKLQSLQYSALVEAPRTFSPEEKDALHKRFVNEQFPKLFMTFFLSIIIAVMGMALLAVPALEAHFQHPGESQIEPSPLPTVVNALERPNILAVTATMVPAGVPTSYVRISPTSSLFFLTATPNHLPMPRVTPHPAPIPQ